MAFSISDYVAIFAKEDDGSWCQADWHHYDPDTSPDYPTHINFDGYLSLEWLNKYIGAALRIEQRIKYLREVAPGRLSADIILAEAQWLEDVYLNGTKPDAKLEVNTK